MQVRKCRYAICRNVNTVNVEGATLDLHVSNIICRKIPGFPTSNCTDLKLNYWRNYNTFVKKYCKLTVGMSESKINLLDQILEIYCELKNTWD